MTPASIPAEGGVLTVVIAGGGTGGHLYPGLALADEIRKVVPGTKVVFVGTRGRIDERVVPARGYRLETIWISGFRRAFSLSLLLFPVKVAVALVQSGWLLRRIRPQVVVGTGGYVCGPVVFCATLMGIPTLLQEQNSYPGVTTRLLSPRVDQVHISFDATRRFLRRADNVSLTGNPTRFTGGQASREEAARFMAIDSRKPTLLVLGGSQGSVAVNSIVAAALRGIIDAGVQVIWQTGERDYPRISAVPGVREAMDRGGVRVFPFIERMELAYATCDLVLARAGATTLAELTILGKPSVLIPLPSAAADHQTENARAMEAAGAAVMVPERDAHDRLLPVLQRLFGEPATLHSMAEKARGLGRPDAARVLAHCVVNLAWKHNDGSGQVVQV